jgi:hypothetical protein
MAILYNPFNDRFTVLAKFLYGQNMEMKLFSCQYVLSISYSILEISQHMVYCKISAGRYVSIWNHVSQLKVTPQNSTFDAYGTGYMALPGFK